MVKDVDFLDISGLKKFHVSLLHEKFLKMGLKKKKKEGHKKANLIVF